MIPVQSSWRGLQWASVSLGCDRELAVGTLNWPIDSIDHSAAAVAVSCHVCALSLVYSKSINVKPFIERTAMRANKQSVTLIRRQVRPHRVHMGSFVLALRINSRMVTHRINPLQDMIVLRSEPRPGPDCAEPTSCYYGRT